MFAKYRQVKIQNRLCSSEVRITVSYAVSHSFKSSHSHFEDLKMIYSVSSLKIEKKDQVLKCESPEGKDAREVEGNALLRRQSLSLRFEGSNPSLSEKRWDGIDLFSNLRYYYDNQIYKLKKTLNF